VFHPRRALGLDQLNIHYHDPAGGEYHDSLVFLLDGLVAVHGTQTSRGAVGGAIKEIAGWEGVGVLQGHDHKLGMWTVTRRTPHGEVSYPAISGGTLAGRDLGYNPKHDVAQGWVVFVVWPDGSWTPTFARHDPQTKITTWNEWRWVP